MAFPRHCSKLDTRELEKGISKMGAIPPSGCMARHIGSATVGGMSFMIEDNLSKNISSLVPADLMI